MAATSETTWASAAELALRIRRHELSPVELMRTTIERIERRNPSLNAFIYLDFEQAMELMAQMLREREERKKDSSA